VRNGNVFSRKGGIAVMKIVSHNGTIPLTPLIDTHVHLDFPELSTDLGAVIQRARDAGVVQMITIGIDEETSRKALQIAHAHSGVFSAVGLHPHEARSLDADSVRRFQDLARDPKVVAVGEIGLDYYRDRQPRETQRRCFRQQLEWAVELRRPVVFHVRDAHADFLEIVRDYAASLDGGILHCFSGDWTIARRCLDLGFMLSIPGTITFPKSEAQREVVRKAPAERILVETDAPFLAPVPFRGKVNEPSYVVHTARKVAELRGMAPEELALQTTANARRVFGLPSEEIL
jgi:TatD DNase family protein